jgi:hypothetical protein
MLWHCSGLRLRLSPRLSCSAGFWSSCEPTPLVDVADGGPWSSYLSQSGSPLASQFFP